MSGYEITFTKDNGETFKIAYKAISEKHAVFLCTNELAGVGVIGVTAVSVRPV